MLSLIEIFGIIISHWIADFVCQTHWQATNKSSNNKALLSHTVSYSIWFTISSFWCALIYLAIIGGHVKVSYEFIISFVTITFICHTITDYFTSRLNTKLWKKGDIHNFFVSVGFDQVLHYVQLFLTYYYLKTYGSI